MSTTFIDGPAKGQRLLLRASPPLLRVTECGGKWDALDQWEDTPREGETLYAYQLAKKDGIVHLNFGRRGGGFYAIAEYRLVADQPMQSMMLDTVRWQAWCRLKVKQANPSSGVA